MIIKLSLLIFLSASFISFSQINGRFVVTPVNSSKIAVKLQINTTTGTHALGGATIVFGFDTTAINLINNPVKNVDYIFHNFNGGYYYPASLTKPVQGRLWVNIDLPYNNSNNGTIVSGSSGWTDVITIYFNIININKPAALYWITSSPFWGIYKDNNLTLLNPGTFQNTSSDKFQLSVNTHQGWNMVSIPGLLPNNQNVTSWWPGQDPAAVVLRYFNGGHITVNTVTPGAGYWMRNLTAQIYNTGDEWPSDGISTVSHAPLALSAGWNVIGGYEESVPIAQLTTTPPGIITGIIYKYTDAGYRDAASLEPGYGYLMKVTASGYLTIPSSSGGSPKMYAGPSTEGFGRIIITDADNKSCTLYTVKGETDLTQFDLPPFPAHEIFDIRYSTQRSAERLNTPQYIEMTGVQYPLHIKSEETDIILSDETGGEIARLKSGEEVMLNSSVWKLTVREEIIAPVYTLEQNYPNPFNPATIIRWQSPAASHHTLKVFDVLGNEVATLVDEFKPAGSYEVVFNSENLASGIYIYRIQAADFTDTKKMVLLR